MTINELIQQVNENLKIIVSQTSLEKFPKLNLEKNNEISRIIDFFGYFNVDLSSGISEEEKINLLLDKLTEFMTSPENAEYIAQIEKLSGSFSIDIHNGLSTLTNTIKPLVESIRDKVSERFELLLKREQAENLISDAAEPNIDNFEFLKWNGLSSSTVNDENIVDLVTNLLNIKNPVVNALNANIVINKIIRPKFKDLDSKSLLENNLENISEYFNKNYKNINSDDAKRFFTMTINKNDYFGFFNGRVKKSFEDIKSISNNIQRIIFDCNNYLDFCDAIKKYVQLNVIESIKSDIYANLDTVKESCYIVLFYCLYIKRGIFKGKLILNKNLINYPEFLKVEKEGFDLTYIANYLKAYYKDRPIPMLGIATSDILDVKDRIEDDIKEINAKILLNKNIIFNGCLFEATKHILNTSFDFISNTLGISDEVLIERLKIEYYQSISSRLNKLNGDLGRVEDAVYDIIMNVFYKPTLIYNLYILINKNLVYLLSENKTIENKDITSYTAKSIVDVMCEFFNKNFIKH